MRITIQDLQFQYPSYKKDQAKLILNIPSLVIEPAETVFLNGPSGCGKSTLLNLIAGTLNFHQGHILLNQTDLKKLSSAQKDQLRGKVMGFIFQQFNLLPYLTVRENIMLTFYFNSQKPESGWLEYLCHQLQINEILNQAADKISTGQAQRVAAARAFLKKPALIIADEPTSSLDSENKIKFMQTLLALQQQSKSTLIFVSHDLSLKENFQRSYQLKQGKII